MRNLKYFFTILLFVACTNSTQDENTIMNDDAVNDNRIILSCEQMLDTTGLKLYPFAPFTDEELQGMSYAYKLERRQIPENFLYGMTSKELFYQFVYTDLSKSMLFFNTVQYGFESATNNNWVYPESLGIILFGLGNVMKRYEFEPFMQLLEMNQHCSDLMMSAMIKNKQTALLIISCIEKFKNRKK